MSSMANGKMAHIFTDFEPECAIRISGSACINPGRMMHRTSNGRALISSDVCVVQANGRTPGGAFLTLVSVALM